MDVKSIVTDIQRDRTQPIDVGILTVPVAVAQESASLLLQVGVKAIWNYTPVRLDLPRDIICENVKLSASFAVLSSRLKQSSDAAGGSPR